MKNEEIVNIFVDLLSATQVIGAGKILEDACVDVFDRWPGKAAAIIYPANTDEVAMCLCTCIKHNVLVTIQGGKTGLKVHFLIQSNGLHSVRVGERQYVNQWVRFVRWVIYCKELQYCSN